MDPDLNPELVPIAQLEAGGIPEKSINILGLKSDVAFEEYRNSPHLRRLFPDLLEQHKFNDVFEHDPQFYAILAASYWNRLKKLTGSTEYAAYAWHYGLPAIYTSDENKIFGDPYVQSYIRIVKGQKKMAKSENLHVWVESMKSKKTHFEHYSHLPDLTELKPEYQGTGLYKGGERARPNRPPRVYVYEVVNNIVGCVVNTGDYKYLVDIPKDLKLYNMVKDPMGLLDLDVKKSEDGILITAPDLDEVENILIKLGYGGYIQPNDIYSKNVVLFRRVSCKRA